MKISKVSVGYGRTINLGNYNSARLDAICEVTLNEDDDPDEAYRLAWDRVEHEVRQGYRKNVGKSSEPLD